MPKVFSTLVIVSYLQSNQSIGGLQHTTSTIQPGYSGQPDSTSDAGSPALRRHSPQLYLLQKIQILENLLYQGLLKVSKENGIKLSSDHTAFYFIDALDYLIFNDFMKAGNQRGSRHSQGNTAVIIDKDQPNQEHQNLSLKIKGKLKYSIILSHINLNFTFVLLYSFLSRFSQISGRIACLRLKSCAKLGIKL